MSLFCGAGVFCHLQVIKYKPYTTGELSHFLSNASRACGLDERNSETPQPCDVFRSIPGADSTAVLVIIPVDNVMATVLDTPVSPIDGEDGLRIGLLRRLAGYAVGDLAGTFACFLFGDVTFNAEYLANMREGEIAVEFWGSPDSSELDSAVIWW